MHVITNLLMGWATAECVALRPREKNIVAWVAVAPDLDGLGLVADKTYYLLGRAEPGWYEAFHHVLLHGLFGAIALAALAAWLAVRDRMRVGLLALAGVHLHILCDIAGSRGSDSTDNWPIFYFGPWREDIAILSWSGQWRLDGWQNVVITAVFLLGGLGWAIRAGRSPLSSINARADRAVVAALQARFRRS
jgi:hypothetical protein